MHHDAAHCTSESEFTRFGAGFIAPPESRPVVQHGSLGETKIFRLIFVSGSVDSLVGEDLLVRGVDLLPSFARKKNFEKKKLQHSTCISRGLPSALRGCCGSSVGCFGFFFFFLIFFFPRPCCFSQLSLTIAIWLILPVVICLSQRLSHACLSSHCLTVKPRTAH